MQVELIASNLAGNITMLARAAVAVVVLLGAAVPVLCGIQSLWTWSESDGSLDLDELWERYKRDEISWDECPRGKIEGTRRLAGTKAASSSSFTPDGAAS